MEQSNTEIETADVCEHCGDEFIRAWCQDPHGEICDGCHEYFERAADNDSYYKGEVY